MGTTKAEEFSVIDNKIATFAKALAHPARIAIIKLLIKKQACICGDIVQELPLSQSTISQHLKELKAIGIIKGNIEGASICYCIDIAVWQQYTTMFTSFLNSPVNKLTNTCC